MPNTIKVCVRVPTDKKEELMLFAAKLRNSDTQSIQRKPGWDAKIIHQIARDEYGSLLGMFEKHGWTERGSKMVPSVQSLVKDRYGSIEAFVDEHTNRIEN